MKRSYALILPFLLALSAEAQVPAQVFEFTCAEDLPMSAEKYLIPGIRELDQNGHVSVEGRTVKVGVASDVDFGSVAQALERAGVGHFRTRVTTETTPTPSASGYPVMVHSEDPMADEAAYQEAKRQWVEAHPERYREMMNASGESFKTDMDHPE